MPKEGWMWLTAGLGYAAVNTGELLAVCPGGPEEVQAMLGGEKLDEVLTQKQAEKLASTRPADYALMLAHAEAQGIQLLPYDDKLYPGLLRNITNPPLLLFAKGDLTLLNGQLCVGMVGARRPSGYGVEAVRTIGRGVALGGAIIVSGLAAGLDSEAHKAALAVNGPTIACIAFGHENCYPAQNKKLMEVIERYGVVLSEYPPDQKPEKPFFLHRNRLIAGLSHALVVAEARGHSGTMSTVNFATEFGRDVFAVPGSIFSELSGGTNAMIRDGAYLAAGAKDILSVYGIELPEEDLTKAAAAQAQEGRPAMASSNMPWHTQGTSLQEERQTQPSQGPGGGKLGEQTLMEALQSQLTTAEKRAGPASGDRMSGDRVSRNAAIDAFRRMQKDMPPSSEEALDARNRALDEMVAAVSDEVDIRRPAAPKQGERSQRRQAWEKQLADEPVAEEKVKPFRWDAVERLTKAEVVQKEKEAAAKRPSPPLQRRSQPAYPVSAVRAVGGLSPVGGVMPVHSLPQPTVAPAQHRPAPTAPAAPTPPATPVAPPVPEISAVLEAPVAPVNPAAVAAQPAYTPASQPRAAKAPRPAPNQESSPLNVFRKEDSLAGMLRTRQKPAGEERTSTFGQPPKKQGNGMAYSQKDGFVHPSPTALPPPAKPFHPPVVVQEGTTPQLAPPVPSSPPLTAHFQFPEEDRMEEEVLDALSGSAKLAFEQLGVNPSSLAQIAKRSGLSPGEAMAALTELELAGISRQLPGRQFVLMQ